MSAPTPRRWRVIVDHVQLRIPAHLHYSWGWRTVSTAATTVQHAVRRSRSTSTFKEEYWYSTFLKVVPFYAHAELLRTPQQCTPRSCTSDARSTAAPLGTSSRNRRPGRHPRHPSSCARRGGDGVVTPRSQSPSSPASGKPRCTPPGPTGPKTRRTPGARSSVSFPPAAEPRRNPNDAYAACAPRTDPIFVADLSNN